jgi:long-chain acyl-CoA synthetase
MLYDRWRQTVRRDPRAMALHELASGRRWTFAELAAEAERGVQRREETVCATGAGADFIIATLRAWRAGVPLCPLEPGQVAPMFPTPPSGIVHVKFTSGTATGVPRLIAFTAGQLAADCDQIVATMGLRAAWPNVGAISLAHSYGFSNLVLPLLLHGVPLVLSRSALPESIREAAQDLEALTLASVPALWRAWHGARAIPSATRLALSAGAPLPVALEQAVFQDFGLKIHNFIGASECGGIAYDRSESPRTDGALAGTPIEGVALSVKESGCLSVRSAAVAETAWPEPDASIGHGMFQTGDLAELDRNELRLLGRAVDLINVAGRKLAPDLVEAALRGHPAVQECVVVGLPAPDDPRGEIITAIINADPAEEASIRAFTAERLAPWQRPRRWWFTRELVPTARGKISRHGWRTRVAAAVG